jgi:hypothetical protein
MHQPPNMSESEAIAAAIEASLNNFHVTEPNSHVTEQQYDVKNGTQVIYE